MYIRSEVKQPYYLCAYEMKCQSFCGDCYHHGGIAGINDQNKE